LIHVAQGADDLVDMGDAINLASRMETIAEPGRVLITEDTHRLMAPLFEPEALGPTMS
jgi:class 3 adenylate cyclase